MMLQALRDRARFDRNEFSGAFGDIGSDLRLIVGMILVAGLDAASVLIVYGALQSFTGLSYGMPMPVQPLKARGVIVIIQKLSANVLYGGGLAIGMVMLLLTVTGAMDWVANAVPKSVVRGIQLGLGLQLAALALKDYVPADGKTGFVIASVAFLIAVLLLGNRRFPPALLIIFLGVAYALFTKVSPASLAHSFGFHLPQFHHPTWADIATGFLVLSLPQFPLSLAHSTLATRQVAGDLFPKRHVTVRQITLPYPFMNLG